MGSLASPAQRWAFNTEEWTSDAEYERALTLVQPEERTRIERFKFRKDAKTAVVGRLLLRRLIHDVTGLPFADIDLRRTKEGKPYLHTPVDSADLPNFNFNVSHHGAFVVLASEARVLCVARRARGRRGR